MIYTVIVTVTVHTQGWEQNVTGQWGGGVERWEQNEEPLHFWLACKIEITACATRQGILSLHARLRSQHAQLAKGSCHCMQDGDHSMHNSPRDPVFACKIEITACATRHGILSLHARLRSQHAQLAKGSCHCMQDGDHSMHNSPWDPVFACKIEITACTTRQGILSSHARLRSQHAQLAKGSCLCMQD